LIQGVIVTADLTIEQQVAEHHRASAGRLPAEVARAFGEMVRSWPTVCPKSW
jgi:hypothetical protein